MTIQIIKAGVKPEERVVEFTCWTCNSLLLAKVSDGEVIRDTGRDGDYVKFACPFCNSIINISLHLFKVPTAL